jgi:hypothetical protein
MSTFFISLGWKEVVAFLGATRSVLFKCIFTNYGQGLSTSLYYSTHWGCSLRKKNSCTKGISVHLLSLLQNKSNWRIV